MQPNGVTKGMNRNILNIVSSMTFFKNVILIFSNVIVLCVVYLKYRFLPHSLDNKTYYEMWYAHIPLVRHFIVFGSTYYALILKGKKKKCIFLGHWDTIDGCFNWFLFSTHPIPSCTNIFHFHITLTPFSCALVDFLLRYNYPFNMPFQCLFYAFSRD